jgi:hypothetical protein
MRMLTKGSADVLELRVLYYLIRKQTELDTIVAGKKYLGVNPPIKYSHLPILQHTSLPQRILNPCIYRYDGICIAGVKRNGRWGWFDGRGGFRDSCNIQRELGYVTVIGAFRR